MIVLSSSDSVMGSSVGTVTSVGLDETMVSNGFEVFRSIVSIRRRTGSENAWVMTRIGSAQVDIDLSSPSYNLMVQVEGGRVTHVRWNGRVLKELIPLSSPPTAAVGSGYGLYNARGTTTFQGTRLD